MSRAPLPGESDRIASTDAAPQHRPRPLPLFLDLLRSETATSPLRQKRALEGLRLYQEAPRPDPLPPMPIAARAGRVTARDFGGDGPTVLFVPSLINPPSVLDISHDKSLLRWLSTQGVRPMLVDWGHPDPAERELSVAGHVEAYLLPLIDALEGPIAIVGYCLGGTMAIAAAARRKMRGLGLIAAPWRFTGFPSQARDGLDALWQQALPIAEHLGVLPMEVLQTAFWKLDPARTIGKFERLAGRDPAGIGDFLLLEDWANDGPPLTLGAARELIEDFFVADRTGRGEWRVGGATVDLNAIDCPVLDIASTTDRIVPSESAARLGDHRLLSEGHVGMIVGGRARTSLWEPLAHWLSRLPDPC